MPESAHARHRTLPRAIGGYEIVGRLAMGGMAEILLARVVGPSGFERVVVIKRILPHLAARSEFVDMFLDEGRIAARIGHPNVAQVFALQEDEGELFQVMEYLEGESAAGLTRRLRSLASRLDYALAAYVVAEACAGLHAAHELCDSQGRPVELVHRDVTPENIFVGYDGTVKVLDFGIAKAANRLSQTEAGLIKGKFAYMSPEQTLGRSLDRRSDIFSLGVVLYELTTQRSLFRRANQPATLQAVNHDPILPPTVIDPDYPRALEKVCMKALSRTPRDRYATARDMQAAILKTLPGLNSPTIPEAALASLMGELFADRIADKNHMLQGLQDGITPDCVPAEVDSSVQIPSVLVELDSRPRPKLALLALVAALALALGVFGLMRLRSTEADPVDVPTAISVAEISIDTSPTGARAWIDGQLVGATPTSIQMPVGHESKILRLELDGYDARTSAFVPDQSRSISVALRPERTPPNTTPDSEAREPAASMRRRPTMRAQSRDEAREPPARMQQDGTGADPWQRFN